MDTKRNIRYIRTLLFSVLLSFATTNASAQYHDDVKMNQFTMQETGIGEIPYAFQWYYELFHDSYRKSINSTNKSMYRAATYQGSYGQVAYADSIRKRLESRAKEEAFNIADREIDAAWLTEQSKIEDALDKYNNNLSYLSACHPNSEELEDWKMYPSMWNFAIDRTRKAYMANSERQKEFLTIYNEIKKKNSKLVSRIHYLTSYNKLQDVISATPANKKKYAECAAAAYNKWREAAWTSVKK